MRPDPVVGRHEWHERNPVDMAYVTKQRADTTGSECSYKETMRGVTGIRRIPPTSFPGRHDLKAILGVLSQTRQSGLSW